MKIEDSMKCEACGKDTVFFAYDSNRKQVRFYPEPHLDEREIRHPNVNLRRKSSRDGPEYYDVMVHCPICGKHIHDYIGVPVDWACIDTPGPLFLTPLVELEPWIVPPRRRLNDK